LEWQEFVRWSYLGVAVFIILLWQVHPLLIGATSNIAW
jgi:uncharacterized membrane protein